MNDAMPSDDGPLVAADESFSHQIVETHARVAQADRSWTEKVCAMAAARDGSLQVAFGVGQVREPERVRRLRRRVARQGAVDRARAAGA